MTRDDCFNSGRPVFRTAHRPVPLRPSCRRAGRTDCLPQFAPPHTIRLNSPFAHLQRDDTSRRADRPRHRISPSDRKPAFPYHITMKTASRSTPRICDTGSGELPPPFACLLVLFPTVRGITRRIPHRSDPTRQIRFAHFPCRVDFPIAMSHRRAIINIPSERSFRGFYSPVEPASLIGLLPATLLFENASFQKPSS